MSIFIFIYSLLTLFYKVEKIKSLKIISKNISLKYLLKFKKKK